LQHLWINNSKVVISRLHQIDEGIVMIQELLIERQL
jgi:hypothetical protein